MEEKRPGPKPKRLYVRLAQLPSPGGEPPARRDVRSFVEALERVGRLVAQGPTSEPPGEILLFRAEDLAEARRILRTDPWARASPEGYALWAWDPQSTASGVNLDPAPARGSGRLTALQRVAVVVRDRTESIHWYRDVLGLRVRTDDPETGYVELSLGRGSAGITLVSPQEEWGEPVFSETLARLGQATGISFETDSVPALELRLRHSGARITEPARRQPWGGVSLRFCDPDGNEFLAYQLRDVPRPSRSARGPASARS